MLDKLAPGKVYYFCDCSLDGSNSYDLIISFKFEGFERYRIESFNLTQQKYEVLLMYNIENYSEI
jgi:hypothetical protein